MARPARIFNGYDTPVQTVSRTFQNGVLVNESQYISDSRRRFIVFPHGVSTPPRSPRDKTNWSSFSYRGSSQALGSLIYESGTTRITETGGVGLVLNDVDFSDSIAAIQSMAQNEALSELLAQKVNLLQALGEMPMTAKLVATSCTRIAKQVSAFRRVWSKKDWSLVKRNLASWRNSNGGFNHGPTDAWLELQYGWKPLVQDVYGSIAQLHGDATSRDREKRGIALAKGKGYDTVTSRQIATEYGGERLYWEVRNRMKCEVKLNYRLDDPVAATLAQVGITNPLTLGWELTPFSFVIDWFLPIGNFLEARNADKGWIFVDGYMSTMQKMEATGETGSLSSGPLTINVTEIPKATGHRFTRLLYSSPPQAVPPRFKSPLSLGHVANGLALLVGSFR